MGPRNEGNLRAASVPRRKLKKVEAALAGIVLSFSPPFVSMPHNDSVRRRVFEQPISS